MVDGQLDMTSLPLDYANSFHPEFSITLMPGIVKNHDHAQRINKSPFMDDIRKIINDAGAMVLADAWLGGGFASKKECVTGPASVNGQVMRAAGPMFNKMLEGAGASKMGSVFIYILVAIIGMKIDLSQLVQYWDFIIIGLIWMAFHVGLLFLVAKIIKAPFFFLAVGSKANVGGAASAPVVASAFHPSLAPVGVLLAVLGYALGTYGALLCATLMEIVSP